MKSILYNNMTKQDLVRVQEINYELLCIVDKICQKYDIQYFLFYGTLLGAVRHQGTIPWDDDVDIAMTRENYLHFIKIAQEELDGKQYFVKIMGSGSTDYVSELKIGRVGTTYCMAGTENTEVMHNVFLDVFCMDYVKMLSPNAFNYRSKLWGLLRTIKLNWSEKNLLCICIDKSGHRFKFFYKLGLYMMHFLRFIIGEKNIEKWGYNLFVDKQRKNNFMMAVSSLSRNIYHVEWLLDTELLFYRDRFFPVPKNYDAVLKTDYKDYMKLPPEEKRYNKHMKDWVFIEER